MKPLVSILIPAFNAEKYIAEALQSAIAQTWDRKEIIVVNDGSTDQTLVIARQFESDCVRIVTQKNQGAAAARNKALSLSHGDYIQWLDADDILALDKIARQMEVLDQCRSERTLCSAAWAFFMYRPHRAKFAPTALWCDLSPGEWLMHKLGKNLHMQTATWLVSRKVTEAAGPWDTRLLGDDDGEYFCRILLASERVRFVPEARVYYRLSHNGLSYIGRSDRKVEAHWISMQMHIRYLLSLEDSERTRAACVMYLQNWLLHFYPERLDIVRKAQQIAKDLGGQLKVPRLSWKYSWIDAIFGTALAKRAQQFFLQVRLSLARSLDKTLFVLENRKRADTLSA